MEELKCVVRECIRAGKVQVRSRSREVFGRQTSDRDRFSVPCGTVEDDASLSVY